MYFAFNEDQEAIRATTRAFLEQVSTPAEVRRVMETPEGYDPAVWRALASELGLAGLLISEEHGGTGLGFVELAAVMQEMGRALLCAPYLSTAVLAPLALQQLGDDESRGRLLPRIAAGELRVAVTVQQDSDARPADEIRLDVRRDGDVFRLRGRKRFVIDGASADLVLVVARADDERFRLFSVEAAAAGLERTPLATLDATRKQADLTFDDVPARAVGPAVDFERIARVRAGASVALAAEQAGGAERTLEDAVEYAKRREQFDRPIGSFQAVKHKCADMLMAAESAKSAAWYAAWATATRASGAEAASHVAKAICSEAFVHNAGENLQIHGGIGFTWESDAHLHLKRARSSWAMFGPPSEHREWTADGMGLR